MFIKSNTLLLTGLLTFSLLSSNNALSGQSAPNIALKSFLVSGHSEDFGPSFDTRKARPGVERLISADKSLSAYDAVLGYLYRLILKELPDVNKAVFKRSQNQWLKKERRTAYQAALDPVFIKNKARWSHPLAIAYGERISSLLDEHADLIKDLLFSTMKQYKTEDLLPKPLKHLLFWYIYRFYANTFEQELSNGFSGQTMPLITAENRLIPLTDGTWVILWRGTSYREITNRDGGIYSAYLLKPSNQGLYFIKDNMTLSTHPATPFSKKNISVDSDNGKKAWREQGYLVGVNNNQFLLASGDFSGTRNLLNSGVEELHLFEIDQKSKALNVIKDIKIEGQGKKLKDLVINQ